MTLQDKCNLKLLEKIAKRSIDILTKIAKYKEYDGNEEYTCSCCNGSGEGNTEHSSCISCGGSGVQYEY